MTSPARSETSGRYQQILDVAAEIFYEKGYAATSIQDIATRAGLLKGSLYHYISSKEDLLLGVMGDFHDAIIEISDEIVAGTPDAGTALRRLIEAHVAYNARHRIRGGVCYNEFRSLSHDNWQRILDIRDRYERTVRGVIVRAQKEGSVRADADARVATFAILGAINSLHHWYREGGPLSPEDVGRQYADTLLDGLTAR